MIGCSKQRDKSQPIRVHYFSVEYSTVNVQICKERLGITKVLMCSGQDLCEQILACSEHQLTHKTDVYLIYKLIFIHTQTSMQTGDKSKIPTYYSVNGVLQYWPLTTSNHFQCGHQWVSFQRESQLGRTQTRVCVILYAKRYFYSNDTDN